MKTANSQSNILRTPTTDVGVVYTLKAFIQALVDNYRSDPEGPLDDGSHRFLVGFDIEDGKPENVVLLDAFEHGYELARENPEEEQEEEKPQRGLLDWLFGDDDEEEDAGEEIFVLDED